MATHGIGGSDRSEGIGRPERDQGAEARASSTGPEKKSTQRSAAKERLLSNMAVHAGKPATPPELPPRPTFSNPYAYSGRTGTASTATRDPASASASTSTPAPTSTTQRPASGSGRTFGMRHLLAAAAAGFLLPRLFGTLGTLAAFGAYGARRRFGANSNWMGRMTNEWTDFLRQRMAARQAMNEFRSSTTEAFTNSVKKAGSLLKESTKPV